MAKSMTVPQLRKSIIERIDLTDGAYRLPDGSLVSKAKKADLVAFLTTLETKPVQQPKVPVQQPEVPVQQPEVPVQQPEKLAWYKGLPAFEDVLKMSVEEIGKLYGSLEKNVSRKLRKAVCTISRKLAAAPRLS